jgi:hypothetical protein
MANKTTITIETDSLLTLRGRTSKRAWCPMCAAEVDVAALEDIGVVSNLDRAALAEWLNSGDLHRLQTADGSEVICLNSLLALVRKSITS